MIGYIYLTTNIINGRKYIGKRQKSNFDKSYKGSGKLLKLAFDKYGKDNFETIILERCNSVKELCDAEIKWISKYRTLGIDLYNIASGGEGGNNVLWDQLPLERRKEINRKNSNSHKGNKNPFYGKHHSPETIARFSETRKGIHRDQSSKNKEKATKRAHLTPILQINKVTGEIIKRWDNWAEAGEYLSDKHGRCAYAHISDCCRGQRKTAYGFCWQFERGGCYDPDSL